MHPQNHFNVMQCFTLIFLMITNKILPQLTHTEKVLSEFKKKVLNLSLSAIWENTDGCNEQYRRASEL